MKMDAVRMRELRGNANEMKAMTLMLSGCVWIAWRLTLDDRRETTADG